ncbi:MAG: NUDIX hydrolase [Microlunatus sp.]
MTLLNPAVSAGLAALADGWSTTSVPAEPRPAASVILCRDADPASAGGPADALDLGLAAPESAGGGLEVYLLQRHARMEFAASMAVFPGGGLDPVDQTAADPRRACAIRETREETGVGLAADSLVPWAHWITPELRPIRYDTFFYLAGLPAGQTAGDISSETDAAGWIRPGDAVNAYRTKSLQLMPPTLSILLELAQTPSVAAAIERGQDRVIEPVLPKVVRGESGWVYRYPRPGADPSGHRGG